MSKIWQKKQKLILKVQVEKETFKKGELPFLNVLIKINSNQNSNIMPKNLPTACELLDGSPAMDSFILRQSVLISVILKSTKYINF